jgi:hypothetical protein
MASRFASGSGLATAEQVLAERLLHAVNLVAWAQGRLPEDTVRVEGTGELDKAFALATAVRLLGAVPHLWVNDVRNAVAEMAVSAATPLPAHVLVSDVIPESGMWWTWETEWSDPQDPTVNTQGVLLHPLPALNRPGELYRSAFAATQLQTDADGHAVVRPGLLGRFGDCYPEDFGAESAYELIARFLAFLNSSYIPEEESSARRKARRWAERQGIPDLMADSVRFVLLRRQPRDRHKSIGAEREHQHRWLVSGHFRIQWYPSEQTHKVVWIAHYVKGPAN